MKLSRLQSSGLAVFAPIYDKVSFLFCSDITLPPGLRVASAGCQIVGSQYSSLFSGLRSIEVSTKSAAKKEAHLLVQSFKPREWVCSSKGSITRAFFPTPESHGRITDMDLSYPITQILSGNSFLNVHQHRFKFKTSPHCSCSDIPESVSHFSLSNLRHSFPSISLTTTGVWPPSLSLIPACPPLWRDMRSYISSTRRLSGRLGS